MMINNQELANILSNLYYGVYEGRNNIESFIEWLENDCPEEDDEFYDDDEFDVENDDYPDDYYDGWAD